jgi:hypothetical protein
MLAGRIRYTRAMKAALRRADARVKRAWPMIKAEQGACLDRELLLASVERFERELASLKCLLRPDQIGPPLDAPV